MLFTVGLFLRLLLLPVLLAHAGLYIAHLLPYLFGRLVNGQDEIEHELIEKPE